MPARISGGTIRRARFVRLDPAANNRVLEADANSPIYGIAQVGGHGTPIPDVTADPPEAAIATLHLNVHEEGAECDLEIGAGGVTAGDVIESDAEGRGITALTTVATVRNIGARALESAAAGTLSRVVVNVYTKTNPA